MDPEAFCQIIVYCNLWLGFLDQICTTLGFLFSFGPLDLHTENGRWSTWDGVWHLYHGTWWQRGVTTTPFRGTICSNPKHKGEGTGSSFWGALWQTETIVEYVDSYFMFWWSMVRFEVATLVFTLPNQGMQEPDGTNALLTTGCCKKQRICQSPSADCMEIRRNLPLLTFDYIIWEKGVKSKQWNHWVELFLRDFFISWNKHSNSTQLLESSNRAAFQDGQDEQGFYYYYHLFYERRHIWSIAHGNSQFVLYLVSVCYVTWICMLICRRRPASPLRLLRSDCPWRTAAVSLLPGLFAAVLSVGLRSGDLRSPA